MCKWRRGESGLVQVRLVQVRLVQVRSVKAEGAFVFHVFVADGAVFVAQIKKASNDNADANADGEKDAVGGEGDEDGNHDRGGDE